MKVSLVQCKIANTFEKKIGIIGSKNRTSTDVLIPAIKIKIPACQFL